MIDDLRTVVYKNIRKLSESSSTTVPIANEYLSVPPPSSMAVQSHPYQYTEDESSHQQQQISSGEEDVETNDNSTNNTFMKKVRGTTKKTIQQAEEGFIKLDNVIRQIRTNIQKK